MSIVSTTQGPGHVDAHPAPLLEVVVLHPRDVPGAHDGESVDDGRLASACVRRDPLVVVLPARHDLADRKRIPLELLAGVRRAYARVLREAGDPREHVGVRLHLRRDDVVRLLERNQ